MRVLPLLALLPLGLLGQINNFSWPLAPMDEQHRISSTFDECRADRDHFHNGTDMPLAPGENVLSIMAGTVSGKGSDWIRVEDFAYVHVIPLASLQIGNSVSQGDVVGHTDSYAHIHLNYGGGASGHPYGNPLLPGKLTPFEDPYHPRSPLIQFVSDGTHNAFTNNTLSGRVDIVAQAADTTDLWSTIDMNNGVYTIGWALLSADTTTVMAGPHFWFEANQYYSSANINYVYAPGSSTSIYRYIVTNRTNANDYLDCSLYEPGPYVISVMSSDTRNNWDTTYVPVQLSDIDLLPPGRPELSYVGPHGDGQLYFQWQTVTDADLAGYILEFSFDGVTWNSNHGPEVLTADMTSFTVEDFSEDVYVEFRMRAVDNAAIPNYSAYSDTYGMRLSVATSQVLIVDGFDRTTGSWSMGNHDFATYYSAAIVNGGLEAAISTASNEWARSALDLSAFDAIIWFLGDDSRTDETFSTEEQATITAYLSGGGNLMASGAEIGYDLSAGSTADRTFLQEVLHISYAGDDANNMTINGVPPYFGGISCTYGTSPYEEDWPDHFTPVHNGEVALQYGNGLTAAVGYLSDDHATFVMGLAFETIDNESNRAELMSRVFNFFQGHANVHEIQIPQTSSIQRVYPNPFNGSVSIEYQLTGLGEGMLTFYDMQGRTVREVVLQPAIPGIYNWIWNGRNHAGETLASGAYFVQLTQSGKPDKAHKIMLIK